MINEVTGLAKAKILHLIKNTNHELSIFSVVFESSPGKVYVDDAENPTAGLIKTPECNVLFGDSSNEQVNEKLFEKLDYFDPVTPDLPNWNSVIEKHHKNTGIRKYKRFSFILKKENLIIKNITNNVETVKLLYFDSYSKINHDNKDMILEGININRQSEDKNIVVAAIIEKENKIVACSALDCIYNDKVEIGIHTIDGYKRKGYGRLAVSSLISELFNEGIDEIGWHCVSTNAGSIKIAESFGFKKTTEYESFSPYPPIENFDDLNADEWIEYANFFEDKTEDDPKHYWQACRCWAKAGDINNTIRCINELLDQKMAPSVKYLGESNEFKQFENNSDWILLINKMKHS